MIFENSLPKANFGQNIRDSPNGSLTADSRSLQTATLKYLHSQGIAHRALKPANVLVANSHYSSLAMEDMGTVFQDRSIICKLTDFGESRSQYAQTHMSMLSSRTSRVDRGTVAYMSPEILLPERTSGPLSMADLMRADVWALGMVFFNLVNPSQR